MSGKLYLRCVGVSAKFGLGNSQVAGSDVGIHGEWCALCRRIATDGSRTMFMSSTTFDDSSPYAISCTFYAGFIAMYGICIFFCVIVYCKSRKYGFMSSKLRETECDIMVQL